MRCLVIAEVALSVVTKLTDDLRKSYLYDATAIHLPSWTDAVPGKDQHCRRPCMSQVRIPVFVGSTKSALNSLMRCFFWSPTRRTRAREVYYLNIMHDKWLLSLSVLLLLAEVSVNHYAISIQEFAVRTTFSLYYLLWEWRGLQICTVTQERRPC